MRRIMSLGREQRFHGALIASRRNRRAQQAARTNRRPDTRLGEKLALSSLLVPLLVLTTWNIAVTPSANIPPLPERIAVTPLAANLKLAVQTPVIFPPGLQLPEITPLAFIIPPMPDRLRAPTKIPLAISQQAYPAPLALPERYLPPLPNLNIATAYPPRLQLPEITPLAFIIPPLPGQLTMRPIATLQIWGKFYPARLTIPERFLPPLPNIRIATAYPPELALPRVTPLAFITPPLPGRLATSTKLSLAISRRAYPVRLMMPEHYLPPLPNLKIVTIYPPRLRLPEITDLAFITPPLPGRINARPAMAFPVHRNSFPARLVIPERYLPPLPNIEIATAYPPRLLLPARRPQPLSIPLPDESWAITKGQIDEPPNSILAALVSGGPRSARGSVCSAASHGQAGWGQPQAMAIPIALTTPAIMPASIPLYTGSSVGSSDGEMPFGHMLVAAVKKQMNELTYYNAAYIKLSYPMGDVPAAYGVCTDVIIRAYRDLGFDLQELVKRARVGSGDINIDHRRTSVLRKFFRRYADSLPITDYPEDYKPGDIVSYHRPFGQSSKSHIAVVSDDLAPSGRPFVLHNRAWGVQKEDALFADKITGHYRFRALRRSLPDGKPYRGRQMMIAARRKWPNTQFSKRSYAIANLASHDVTAASVAIPAMHPRRRAKMTSVRRLRTARKVIRKKATRRSRANMNRFRDSAMSLGMGRRTSREF